MNGLDETLAAFDRMRQTIRAGTDVYRPLLRQLEGMAAHQDVPTIHHVMINDLRSTIERGQTLDASLLVAINALRRGDRSVRVSQSLVALGSAYQDYVAAVLNAEHKGASV